MSQTELDFTANVHTDLLAGADEAGRGPLAGPVVAAAVILDPQRPIAGLNDSKKLSEKRRNALAEEIKANALSWAIIEKTPAEIDDINILQASLLAMADAARALSPLPHQLLVDGNKVPEIDIPVSAIVGGDATIMEISAASILAKVHRDALMVAYAEEYPEFGFEKHKGYPTAAHVAALNEYGVTEIHRLSYKPVQTALAARGHYTPK